jgi:hypothetical protein
MPMPDAPAAPVWYSHEAANAWQNGWEAGYSAAIACTGTTDRIGRFGHDGDTCPVHEFAPAVVPEHNRYSFVPKENYE